MSYGNRERVEERRAYPQTSYDYRYQPRTATAPLYEVTQPGPPLPRPLEPSPVHPAWTPQLDTRLNINPQPGLTSRPRVETGRNGHREQLPSIQDLIIPASASRASTSLEWAKGPYGYGVSPYTSPSARIIPQMPADSHAPYQSPPYDVQHSSQYTSQHQQDLAGHAVVGPTSGHRRSASNIVRSPPRPPPEHSQPTPYLQLPITDAHLQLRQQVATAGTSGRPNALLAQKSSPGVPQRRKNNLGAAEPSSTSPVHANEQYIQGEGRVFMYDNGSHCKTEMDGEKVNPSWGLTKAGRPRKRLAQACLPCREKKVKCEPGRRPERCMHCEKAQITCRRPETPRSSDGSASTGPSPPRSTTSISRRSSTGKHRRGSNSSAELAMKRRSSIASGSDVDEQAKSMSFAPASKKAPSKDRKPTSPSTQATDKPNGSDGKSSQTLLDEALDAHRQLRDPIMAFWETDPYEQNPDLTLNLLNYYFTHVNAAMYCMFPRKTFMGWVKTQKDKSSDDKMLLFTMMALGSIFTYDSRKKAAGKDYAEIARYAIEKNHGNFSLQLVQSRLLFGLYSYSRGNFTDAWDYSGSTISAVIGSRLHLEKYVQHVPDDLQMPYGLSPIGLTECRRRTFWSSFLLDRYNSLGSGYLCTIQIQDTFLRLPCQEAAYEEGAEVETPYFDNGIIGEEDTKPAEPTTRGAMAYLVLISAIWGHVLVSAYRAVYRPNTTYKEAYERSYGHAENRLSVWMEDLPSCLYSNQKNAEQSIVRGYVGTFISLHALYHTTVMQLNRNARADLLPASTIRRNIRIARQHAHQLLTILRTLYEADREGNRTEDDEDVVFALATPFTGIAIQCAVDILSAGGLRTQLLETRDLVKVAHAIAQQLSKFWSSAKDQRNAIEARLDELEELITAFRTRSRMSVDSGSGAPLAGRCWRLDDPMEMDMGFDRGHDCMYGSDARTFFEAVTSME